MNTTDGITTEPIVSAESKETTVIGPHKRATGVIAVVIALALLGGGVIAYNYIQARAFMNYAATFSKEGSVTFDKMRKREGYQAFLNDPVFESAEWAAYAAVIDGDELNWQAVINQDLAKVGSIVWLPWLQDDVTDAIYDRNGQFQSTPTSLPMNGSPASVLPVLWTFTKAAHACEAGGDVEAYLRENPLTTSALVGDLPIDPARSQDAADVIAPLLIEAAAEHICGTGPGRVGEG